MVAVAAVTQLMLVAALVGILEMAVMVGQLVQQAEMVVAVAVAVAVVVMVLEQTPEVVAV
jgi:hypothetical protein